MKNTLLTFITSLLFIAACAHTPSENDASFAVGAGAANSDNGVAARDAASIGHEIRDTLSNGSPFFAAQNSSLPRNIYLLSFQGGPARFAPAKQGALAMLLELYNEGPKDLSLKDYNQQLFDLGAEIDYTAGPGVFEIMVKSPPAEQAKVFELVRRTLRNPRLEKSEFEKVQAATMAGLRVKFEDMRTVISYFAPLDLMNYNPAILAGQTSPTSFAKVDFKDVKDGAAKLATFDTLFVSYIGADAPANVKAMLNSGFAKELKAPYSRPAPARVAPVKVDGVKYVIIDKPGATDNQVLAIYPQSVQRDGPQWIAAKITMDRLGGGLHGVLGKTLRVERGLTYGASSGFSNSGLPHWVVSTFGGVQQTKGLLQGIPEVVGKFQNSPLSATDLAASKARLLDEFKSGTELPQDLLMLKSWYYQKGFDQGFLDHYEQVLQSTSQSDVVSFQKALQTHNTAFYLMGDQKVLTGILDSMNVPRGQVRIVNMADIQ